jgi:predicted nucleic acid-binding protein
VQGHIHLYGVDAMLFVYHFENNPEFGSLAAEIFQGAEDGRHRLVTSVLSLMEVLVVPKRHGMTELAQRYREIFESFPNLEVLPIGEAIVEIASDLRARHNLRTPDSLHLATAIHGRADAFLSNDKNLQKVTEIPVRALKKPTADLR